LKSWPPRGCSVNQQQFFEQVIRSLEQLNIPYMITGSVAWLE